MKHTFDGLANSRHEIRSVRAGSATLMRLLRRNSAVLRGIRRTIATKDDIELILARLREMKAQVRLLGSKLVDHDRRLDELEKGCLPAST